MYVYHNVLFKVLFLFFHCSPRKCCKQVQTPEAGSLLHWQGGLAPSKSYCFNASLLQRGDLLTFVAEQVTFYYFLLPHGQSLVAAAMSVRPVTCAEQRGKGQRASLTALAPIKNDLVCLITKLMIDENRITEATWLVCLAVCWLGSMPFLIMTL